MVTITKNGASVTVDLYELAEALEIKSHSLFNAWKKLIRRGRGAKSEREDLEESKQSVDRYLRDLPPEKPLTSRDFRPQSDEPDQPA